MERLSGLDASFLYLETPTLHMHVAMSMVFDPTTVPGGYSFEKMRDHIAERVQATPVFRRTLVEVPLRLGHPVWIDDPSFDIAYHVRRAAVPSPGGLFELAEFTSEITSQQLDRSRPLWEIWIIEGLADGRIALVAKMHHATVDGMSGAALLSVLFDLEADPAPPVRAELDHPGTHDAPGSAAAEIDTLGHAPSVRKRTGDPVPSGLELVTTAMAARARLPLGIMRDLVSTGLKVLDVRKVRSSAEVEAGRAKAALPLSAPRTSFNASLTRRRRVSMAAIGLDDIKRLKNATGTTVNDVVLAVCTGALRDLLIEGDELPEKPLVAVVPVSVQPDGDQNGAMAKSSNQISSMFVQLPTQLHNPLARLQAIREGTKGAKDEHHALGADTLLNWAEYAAPNVFANAARVYSRMRLADFHRPVANLVISNVPGPDFPLYLAGAEMQSAFPLGPVIDGMGVNITVMSYRGVLYWGFIGCPDAMPKIWELARSIPRALDDLLQAAGLEPAGFRSEEAAQALRAVGIEPDPDPRLSRPWNAITSRSSTDREDGSPATLSSNAAPSPSVSATTLPADLAVQVS